MTTLRPYQRELVDGVHDAWTRHRSVLMQLGTGGGKTHTAATLISELPGRVVFAAHLDSLVTDTARRLRAHGVECGVVAAGHDATPDARVQVCSLGTLHARSLTPPAETVVLDECHRAQAGTVRAWLERYPSARHLGLTATPQRGDGQPLGDVYDVMVQGPTVAELTEAGHLVASHVLAPPEGTRGDVVREMGDNMTADDNAIVFARSKQEGNVIAQRLRAMGYPCAEVYGDTSARRREEARDRLRAGDLRAIVGVGVFLEGWDEPSVSVVALSRPFGSVGAYLQAIGRGLRPHFKKRRCLVLDAYGAVRLHGLPDEGRRWTLEGSGVTRTEPGLRITRCGTCWAVFRAASRCPRCGEPIAVVADAVQRTATRAERMELVESMPRSQRYHAYYRKLYETALTRMRMSPHRASAWAKARTDAAIGAQE
jgi:DNA repair protein RadD